MNISTLFHRPADLRGACCRSSSSLAALIAMFKLPISRIPGSRAAVGGGARAVSGREPEGDRRNRRHAAGGADQRRREHAVHARRRRPRDGTLTLTVTFKLGTDAGQAKQQVQNRVSAGAAAPAGRRAPARRHDDQELARPDDGRAPDFAERPLRQTVSAQLRAAATSRTSWRASRAWAGAAVRRGRLRHARLARSAEGRRSAT